MRHRMLPLALTCAALAGLAAAPLQAGAPGPAPTGAAGRQAGLVCAADRLAARALAQWRAPGAAITIVRHGEVVLARGYGTRNPATGAPMTADTLFPIQSATKAFTAATLALLVTDGRIDLDAPARAYIPGLRMADPAADREASLRDFLTHRAGLGQYGWLWLGQTGLSRSDAVARLAHLPPAGPFRADFRYANLGYVLAARAVENVSGAPWEDVLRDRLLVPLGMERTTTSLAAARADPDHSAGSMWLWGAYRTTPLQGTSPLTNSTGGIYSTATDMAKWLAFQLGDGTVGPHRLLSGAALREMHTAQVVSRRPVPEPEFTHSDYGLGWFVDGYRGRRLINHQGNHWGVSSSVGLVPDEGLGVSVFVNQDGDLAAFLMFAIIDACLGVEGRDWIGEMGPPPPPAPAEAPRPLRLTAQDRAAYPGVYDSPGFGQVTITLGEAGLEARFEDDRTQLAKIGPDLFVPTTRAFGNIWSMQEGQKIAFQRNFAGAVTGLRINSTEPGIVFARAE